MVQISCYGHVNLLHWLIKMGYIGLMMPGSWVGGGGVFLVEELFTELRGVLSSIYLWIRMISGLGITLAIS